MAEIGRWGGHSFEVSANLIRGFTGLTIKGAAETEDKTSGGQKYVARKNSKPTEISVTIELNAAMGCDVRGDAMLFVNHAAAGKKDYFYVGNKKLVTCQLMLTEASVKEIGITNAGEWTRAQVALTMKQCSKLGSTSSGSSSGKKGGSKKASTKTSKTTTSEKTTGIVAAVAGAISGAVKGAAAVVTKAQSAIKTIVNNVKKAQPQVDAVSSAAKSVSKSAKKTIASKAKSKIQAVKAVTKKSTIKKNGTRLVMK